jgi:hypothetical protein
VDAHVIVVAGKLAELTLKIQTVPEQYVIQILSADSADQPFDERVRAGHEGYGFDFFNLEYPQIRSISIMHVTMTGYRVVRKPALNAPEPVEWAAPGRGCVKTLEALMVQCIFGHVGSISRDFVDSNRALSNLHGKRFGF